MSTQQAQTPDEFLQVTMPQFTTWQQWLLWSMIFFGYMLVFIPSFSAMGDVMRGDAPFAKVGLFATMAVVGFGASIVCLCLWSWRRVSPAHFTVLARRLRPLRLLLVFAVGVLFTWLDVIVLGNQSASLPVVALLMLLPLPAEKTKQATAL